ncbi:MAG TPA: tRNA lysidine(34) synthetase TilS [Chitinolyticbacter sp.]|nr:tRNA lysidine(34) synthetase TilS [Chitinolyticbacter sp.]
MPPSDLAARIEACLARQPALRRICVGFSGGLDSTVLLHLLAGLTPRLGLALSALHVHHGLSPHADAWADFAASFTASLGVPCRIARVQVDRAGVGVEAGARTARYAEFAHCDADALLLAHHRDDQAETVLFNAVRGAGLAGLAAMPETRLLRHGLMLLRPLLDTSRAELAAYAADHQLSWIEDESNTDPVYDRNYLRLAGMPALRARFPALDAGLARVARHAAEAEALLAEHGRLDVATCLNRLGGFELATAATLGELRARHALRSWLRQLGAQPDERSFDELLRQARTDTLSWSWRDLTVRGYRRALYVVPPQGVSGGTVVLGFGQAQAHWVPEWGGTLSWRRGVGVREEVLAGATLELRPRRGGERLRAAAGRPSRALKQLCQEAGVPPWQRIATPLLYLDGVLMAWPGVAVNADLACADGWWPHWQIGSMPDATDPLLQPSG